MYNGKCFRCNGEIESCEDPYCEECYKIVQDEYRENLKKQNSPTGRNLFKISEENIMNRKNNENVFEELIEASRPLRKWLLENENPHAKIIVEIDRVDLLDGKIGIPNLYEDTKKINSK